VAVRYHGDSIPDIAITFGGVQGDVPLVSDWNGDGVVDLVIYRGGAWFINTTRVRRRYRLRRIRRAIGHSGRGSIPVGNFGHARIVRAR
jgi:hypothetical protein